MKFRGFAVRSLASLAVVAGVALFLGGTASADSVTKNSGTIANTNTSWYTVGTGTVPFGQAPIADLAIEKFDSSLGVLKQVDVSIFWTAHLEYSVRSTVGEDQLFFESDKVTLSSLLPNGQHISAGPPELDLGSQVYDPVFDVYNPTGVLHGFETLYAGPLDLSGSSMVSFSTLNGDNLASFIGLGSYNLPTSGIAEFTLNNDSGNIVTTPHYHGRRQGFGDVYLRYARAAGTRHLWTDYCIVCGLVV
jgi:hypothetical protein